MEINIPLESDSYNTYHDNIDLCFTINDYNEDVYIKLSDDDREVSIKKNDFLKIASIIKGVINV